MNDDIDELPPKRPEAEAAPLASASGRLLLGSALIGAGLLGGLVGASIAPHSKDGGKVIPSIVQVIRPRPWAPNPADTVDAVCPAIVLVAAGPAPQPDQQAGSLATQKPIAAGILVSTDGQILTAAAALPADGPLTVLTSDGRRLDATRGLTDDVSGLALIKIDGTDLPALSFADSGSSKVGSSGLLISGSTGIGCTAVSASVSGDFLTDGGAQRAYVRFEPDPGELLSGVPFVTADGKVAGMLGLGDPQDPSTMMPGALAGRIASELLRGSVDSTNALGFVADDITSALAGKLGDARLHGALILLVAPGTPADKAGLMAGDIVVTANAAPVSNASELARAIDGAGAAIPLQILRRAEPLTLTITRPQSGAQPQSKAR